MTILSREPKWTTLDALRSGARGERGPIYGVYHLLRDGERYGVLGHSPLEMCCLCEPAHSATFACPTEALPEPMEWGEATPIIERWRGRDPGCELGDDEADRP